MTACDWNGSSVLAFATWLTLAWSVRWGAFRLELSVRPAQRLEYAFKAIEMNELGRILSRGMRGQENGQEQICTRQSKLILNRWLHLQPFLLLSCRETS